jgi:hypothetical protein
LRGAFAFCDIGKLSDEASCLALFGPGEPAHESILL